MKHGQKNRMMLVLMGMLLAGAVLLSLCVGRYAVNVRELLGICASWAADIEPFWSAQTEIVFMNIRLPRVLLACLVGASLAGAGAAYQGVFQNPMASPDLLGASAGAAFGAALAILLNAPRGGVTAAAFAGAILAIVLVWTVGRFARGKQVLTLVLAGMMISSLFQAGTSYIKLAADPANQLPAITYWMMGSLSGARRDDVAFALVPMVLGMAPLLLLRWRLNLLTLGDDEARTLGVNVSAVRLTVIVCSTLLTAAAVSVSGTIGWVGLVVPHLARRLIGNDYRYLMPASLMGGALFLLLVDDVSRNMAATEIPLGILTAFLGAPFFLWLILRKGELA
ncbi:MAG: iron ABC transporter permease [Clostridia bacterium]|nr:iron ABC transporter permease [Clostridia bacterium]